MARYAPTYFVDYPANGPLIDAAFCNDTNTSLNAVLGTGNTDAYRCWLRLNGNVALTAGANVALSSWTASTNPQSIFSSGAGTITIPSLTGSPYQWRVQLHSRFTQVAGGARILTINRNSTTVTQPSIVAQTTESTGSAQGNGDIFDCVYDGPLNAGDVLRFFAYSDAANVSVTAATLATTTPPGDTWLSCRLVGAF